MRLDAFLRSARLVKKREAARELFEAGRLDLNGSPGKPSRKVAPGDTVVIRFWRRHLTVKVLDCPAGNVSRKQAPSLYQVVEERLAEEL